MARNGTGHPPTASSRIRPIRTRIGTAFPISTRGAAPTELWTLPWRTTFDAGLVRFTQRVHALGVHGLFAGIYTLRTIDGACVFLSEHTADATRSSDDSLGNA